MASTKQFRFSFTSLALFVSVTLVFFMGQGQGQMQGQGQRQGFGQGQGQGFGQGQGQGQGFGQRQGQGFGQGQGLGQGQGQGFGQGQGQGQGQGIRQGLGLGQGQGQGQRQGLGQGQGQRFGQGQGQRQGQGQGQGYNTHFMGLGFPNGGHPLTGLCPEYYRFTCPQADEIVISVLKEAMARDPRIAASLLRLHFHDCFVQGCDASVLLDDNKNIVSEKNAVPNKNSLRGFEVIDQMKARLEEACPNLVSCADIVALAARASVILSGGPGWELPLGRKDSKTASLNGANVNIPPPNSTIQNLITLFDRQGLDQVDLAALSGGHTIGFSRCVSFKQRLYNQNNDNKPDVTLERSFYYSLTKVCPPSGGDNNIFPLDLPSPVKFDNDYYKSILTERGLLNSDEVLLTGNVPFVASLIKSYAEDQPLFFDHFAKSMVKMGNINPLTGYNGEVRKNCRIVNGGF